MTHQAADQAHGLRARLSSQPVARARRPRDPQTTPFVLAVTSGKGGVGKTHIAANVGVTLARSGLRVMLLDADLGLASLDLALGVSPGRDLRSVLHEGASVREVLVTGPHGVRLLAACPGRYDVANLSDLEREQLIAAALDAASDFDVLLIDTGAGIGTTSVAFAGIADEIIVVATPDPVSLRDAYAMTKVLHRRAGVTRIHLVANQVASEREGAEIHERLATIVAQFLPLSVRYLGALRRDETVSRALGTGCPFVVGSPDSQASQAIARIAARLMPLRDRREVPC